MSLATRAALAVLLFVGFYALALALAGGLLMLPVAEVMLADRIHPKLALLCIGGAGIIVWSILPSIDRFEAPGPRLERQDHPDLFEAIDRVARATEQSPPVEVYLVPDVNAFVAERGGLMGIGRKRVMGLGLPLLQVLTVPQLRAVLAHEFGHYHGGDTALGPWIHRTRSAMGRTIQNLGGSGVALLQLLQVPFQAYAKLFLRVTLAVSRAQEYAADRLAAKVEGPRPLTQSLRAIHGASVAFGPYLEQELLPVLNAGYRPPVAAGFAAFVGEGPIASAIASAVDREIAQGQASPWDSHPCLRDRIAALEGLDEREHDPDDRAATALLGDLAGCEAALLRHAVTSAPGMQPVAWEEVGTTVLLPQFLETAGKVAEALRGRTLGTPPVDQASLEALARTWLGNQVAPDRAADAGAHALEAAVLVSLAGAGFTVASRPGQPVQAVRDGGAAFVPGPLLTRIRKGEADLTAWTDALRAAGADPDRHL